MAKRPVVDGLQELIRVRCEEIATQLGQLREEPIDVEPVPETHPADHADRFVPAAVRNHRIVRCETQLRILRSRMVQLASGAPVVCPDCEQPIDADRLHSVPDAERCVGCQREREREYRRVRTVRTAYL